MRTDTLLVHALLNIAGAAAALLIGDLRAYLLVASLAFLFFLISGVNEYRHLRPFGGIPNLITLLRLILLYTGALLAPSLGVHVFGAVVIAVMVMDGFDGYAARKLDQRTELGALFDMEVDASMALLLTIYLAVDLGYSEILVAGGLLRYGFVVWRKLSNIPGHIRPNVRGAKVLAVVFFSCLLTPIFLPHFLSRWLVWVGLIVVFYSFTVEAVLILKKTRAADH